MTPGCTLCGYAVEWVRSCYTSEWRLFKDHPEVRTRGRYVFVPENTPHYQAPHNYGSRIWTSDERQPGGPLGEVDDFAHQWANGQGPPAFPPAFRIGRTDCIAEGERYPLPVIPREFVLGFDARCWARDPLAADPRPWFAISPTDREFQILVARIIDAMYTNDPAAVALLQDYLGPSAVITVSPTGPGLYPGSIIAVTPQYTVVILSGTANFQQLATQVLYAGFGPVPTGGFSTNALWFAASIVIGNRIDAAGANPNLPIIMAGHSYGGATASILAGRYRQVDATRDIRLLTFASPKPGDDRLSDLLSTVPGIHIANSDDPVPSLPPSGVELLPLLAVIPPQFILQWIKMRATGGQAILFPNGTLLDGTRDTLTFSDLVAITAAVVAGDPLTAFIPHEIKSYLERLLLTPP
jgi:hypothetical protein